MAEYVILHGPDDGAAREFQSLFERVTGRRMPLCPAAQDDGKSPAILIGGEAVNPVTAELAVSGEIPYLEFPAGSDDYLILSVETMTAKRKLLLLAGARCRADYYAVYRYFREYAGCRYFWDGDRIPHCDALPVEGVSLRHHFRFSYRGLRYFAHRSLHRFQAEHWDWEEWKQELDYLLKSQLNLFMLRIGNDDLFQRAFPDIVPYPPEDGRAPGSIARSYNDRTSFWPLQYRGELRQRILDYAKSHDLIHPEDMGPFTHWYSATPVEFLEHFKPAMLNQSTATYSENTMKVWDFRQERERELYWQMTRAHIGCYNTVPSLFHCIGLAERKFGTDEESFRLKLYTYKRFIERLRRDYPDTPLLLASWDFFFRWAPEDVRKLLKCLNPANTIILEYTTDSTFARNNFKTWGLPHHFPWIFGIFQGLEPQNTLGFDYTRPDTQLAELSDDPMCCGMVMWSENSHANARLLDYLSRKASGENADLAEFCRSRYQKNAPAMEELWRLTEVPFRSCAWTDDRDSKGIAAAVSTFGLARQGKIYATYPFEDMRKTAREQLSRPGIPARFYEAAAEILRGGACGDPMVRRDWMDLMRTALKCEHMREWLRIQCAHWVWREGQGSAGDVRPERLAEWTRLQGEVLSQHDDFSLYVSYRRLFGKHHVNAISEEVLKGNSENGYCRAQISEFYPSLYVPQAQYYADYLAHLLETNDRESFADAEAFESECQRLRDNFYETPLEKLAAALPGRSDAFLLTCIDRIIALKLS